MDAGPTSYLSRNSIHNMMKNQPENRPEDAHAERSGESQREKRSGSVPLDQPVSGLFGTMLVPTWCVSSTGEPHEHRAYPDVVLRYCDLIGLTLKLLDHSDETLICFGCERQKGETTFLPPDPPHIGSFDFNWLLTSWTLNAQCELRSRIDRRGTANPATEQRQV